jgi:shikimate 5-dehydrogenase
VADVEWHPWGERDKIVQMGGLLVNATSVKDETLVDNWDVLTTKTDVIDLTYGLPQEPYLTQNARFKGITVITGKDFLVLQAQKSFQYWTGICPKITPDLLGRLI